MKKPRKSAPLEHPYESFDHIMLLEDDYKADGDEELCDSFNVYAAKGPMKRRGDLGGVVKKLKWQNNK